MTEEPLILIIDDDPGLLLGVTATIKKHGYRVISAVNGVEGLEKARAILPDLILSDVMMPPPNGFELRRMMGEDPQLSSIPFIFLTARSASNDKVNAICEGADDYITKPFIANELVARIGAVLRRVKIANARGRDQAKSEAEKDLERVRSEILQNFHHELRTPLANIMMPLELAVNNKFDSPEQQSKFLKAALSNADRLESLTTDLIMLSNIDQGNLNRIRQPINLKLDIYPPLYRRLGRYAAKNLDFCIDIPEDIKLSAPRRELIHALVHLADNAFKFSPASGRVFLQATALTEGGIVLEISDNGPGIHPNLHEKVFERFYQASQGDCREFEGLGVGLTLVRAVFKSLGGDVRILKSVSGCHIQAALPRARSGEMAYGN